MTNEFPTEMIIWIVIGVAWAVAQVFAKMHKKRAASGQSQRKDAVKTAPRELRPRPNTDPVSPNEELRRFIRELSGESTTENAEAETEKKPREQYRPRPAAAATLSRPFPVPPNPPRSFPKAPPAPVAARVSPAARQEGGRKWTSGIERRFTTEAIGATSAARRPQRHVATFSSRQPWRTSKTRGFGNWRAAVLHREILGPPRALRPYSADEF